MKNLRIVFLTGTRADYGKLKSLMLSCEEDLDIDLYVYVTGMHLLNEYGNTYKDVLSDGYANIHIPDNYCMPTKMDLILANTIVSFSKYIDEIKPDYIVVHGDRVEPLAGAIVGVLNNIKVIHIEGGEITGTADEFIRHAVSKLSSLHFVSNYEAKLRLIQLGERKETIFIFGSPDIDIMLSDNLPTLEEVKKRNSIEYSEYAIFCYHPVTTADDVEYKINQVVDAIGFSNRNYIVIYPNNDKGSEIICSALSAFEHNSKCKCFKSIPFEEFIVLLKNSQFIIGNSSSGIREACIFGIPAIDIGTRQNGRYNVNVLKNIQHTTETVNDIIQCINDAYKYRYTSYYYGNGHSAETFMNVIKNPKFNTEEIQKTFVDTSETQLSIMNYINEVSF